MQVMFTCMRPCHGDLTWSWFDFAEEHTFIAPQSKMRWVPWQVAGPVSVLKCVVCGWLLSGRGGSVLDAAQVLWVQ